MALTIELRARGVAADLKGSMNENMEEGLRRESKKQMWGEQRAKHTKYAGLTAF
jgi:hypothetical protein